MKHILTLLLVILTLTSCITTTSSDSTDQDRIKVKYSKRVENHWYEIIEIDGVEYICNYSCIYPLVKDTTSKKTIFKVNK